MITPTQKTLSLRRSRRVCAFSLPEVLIASVILAFIVAALTQAVVAGQMQTYASIHEKHAIELAESLLDEVLALDYDDPEGATTFGPDAGESSVADFDNIDDYHNYTQAADDIRDIANVLLPDKFQSFSRTVTVAEETLSVPTLGGDHEGLRLTVTVVDVDGRTWTLARWVAKPTGS
ncbi:type IV pilus modification PilV family protein [Poriferisphaera sp. WC338]|uniref:type IV pilus modification PilV family protein n=1 Tax=Poriferisphaera sp. WC338 TaxID=3425129 RepID=UPI003D818A50